MIKIEQGKEIMLHNLLSLRKKVLQSEINDEMAKINKFLKESGIDRNGPIVTTTFSVEIINGQTVLDVEILVPLDRKMELNNEYKYKEVFHLVNAIYTRHLGNPADLQTTYNKLIEYINENNLHQITPGYNVTVNDIMPGQSLDDVVIDIYIGINPSKL